jgi:DNA-binding transcriptional MerR regulator
MNHCEKSVEEKLFLSAADASRVLGVTPATVRLMARRRDLPVAAMTEGGMHLFRRKDVEALARRRAARKEGR